MYGFKVTGDLKDLEVGVEYEFVKKGEHDRLKKRLATLEDTVEQQGKHAMRRHDVLCSVKEVIDEYFGVE